MEKNEPKDKNEGRRLSSRHVKRLKTRVRYRFTLYNENSLNRVWSLRVGGRRLWVVSAAVVLAIFCFGVGLISFTPLRTLLPGYLRNTERREYLESSERLDSLLRIVAVNDYYLANVTSILDGTVTVDSLSRAAVELSPDSVKLSGRSAAEDAFIRRYREREGFSPFEQTGVKPDAPAFVVPVRDAAIGEGTSPKIEIGEEPVIVYAIARGRVIDTYEGPAGGYVVILQHPDGYVSRYTGLQRADVVRGNTVRSGQQIGRIDPSEGYSPGFGLSRDGEALVPSQYIAF